MTLKIKLNTFACSNSIKKLIGDFDFEYFFSDIAKFAFTFLYDYDLYYHWTWAYFLQNTNVYTATGLPDERLFNQELLRVTLIHEMFKPDSNNVENPIPELFHYWQKNIAEITLIGRQIVTNGYFTSTTKNYLKFIFEVYSNQSCQKLMQIIAQKHYPINKNLNNGDEVIKELLKPESTEDSLEIEKSHDILRLIHKKSCDYSESIKKENAVVDDELKGIQAGTYIFISAISHATLSILKEDMNNKLALLRRDWDTGEPNTKFVQQANNSLLIDTCGGFSLPI